MKKNGAVLAEALLAVLILSLSLVAVIGNFSSSAKLAQKSAFYQKLTILLQYQAQGLFKMEQVKDGDHYEGPFPEPYSDCSYVIDFREEEIDYEDSMFPDQLDDIQPRFYMDLTIIVPKANMQTFTYQTRLAYSNLDFLDKPKNILTFRLEED